MKRFDKLKTLRDLLSLVGVLAQIRDLKKWTGKQRESAETWAAATWSAIEENDGCEIPLKMDCVVALPKMADSPCSFCGDTGVVGICYECPKAWCEKCGGCPCSK